MRSFINSSLHFLSGLARLKKKIWLVLLAILAGVVIVEFFTLGLARRTFVFYDIDNGHVAVEDRNLRVSPFREVNITRYVDEAVLGPFSPDSLPLFPRDTRLKSLLFRDGVVFLNLSEDAALPPVEGGEVFNNFKTLYTGIRRNFSYVRDVRFFIAGNPAYAAEFRQDDSALMGAAFAGLKWLW